MIRIVTIATTLMASILPSTGAMADEPMPSAEQAVTAFGRADDVVVGTFTNVAPESVERTFLVTNDSGERFEQRAVFELHTFLVTSVIRGDLRAGTVIQISSRVDRCVSNATFEALPSDKTVALPLSRNRGTLDVGYNVIAGYSIAVTQSTGIDAIRAFVSIAHRAYMTDDERIAEVGSEREVVR